MAEPDQRWAEEMTRAVGARILRWRKARGMTAQQLSDALTGELGIEMKRSTLSALESGARKTIAVTELLAIAYTLRVAPILLLFDVGDSATTPALPGHDVDTWQAQKWFIGEAVFPGRHADDRGKEWEELRGAALPLQLYREHERLIEAWVAAASELNSLEQPNSVASSNPEAGRYARKLVERDIWDAESAIRRRRNDMHAIGMVLPDLPEAR